MIKFSIKIDDDNHTLSKENGIPFDKFGELLKNLYEAIDPENGSKCTLGEIRGNCYAADFYTEDEKFLNNFIVVHKNVEQVPVEELEPKQRDYARTLRKVLGGKFYMNAYDEKGEKFVSIKEVGAKSYPDYYYTNTTVYGIVSQMGAPALDATKKSINIDGVKEKVSVTKDQDLQLKEHYATNKLRLKIRQRRSAVDGHILSSELISFNVVGKKTLIENLSKEGYIDFALIKNTETIEDIVNRLYGNQD